MIMVTDKYSLHLPEVHAHGDGELLVVNGEDVQDLHIDVHVNWRIWSGGLQLLIILGKTPAKHTFQHV